MKESLNRFLRNGQVQEESIMETIKQFSKDEEGQGLVEYILIISLISIAAIITMGFAGDALLAAYNSIVSELNSVF